MTAPVPIVSGDLLTPARLNIPSWQTYASTIWTAATTNPSIGNGVVSLRWRYLDPEQVQIRVIIRPGSTTTFGTGAYRINLPVPAISGGPDVLIPGAAFLGSPLYPLMGWATTASSSATFVTVFRSNSTTESVSSWTSTAPATFANGHSVMLAGSYYVA